MTDGKAAGMQAFEPLWDTWYLEEPIGAGSYGTVYRAKQTILGHTYTSAVKHISIPRDEIELKSIKEELAADDEDILKAYYDQEVRKIVEEFHIQKQFSGRKNFVQVFDLLPVPKKDMPGYDLFLRMELLGEIRSRFHDSPDREKEAVRLGMDICTALSEMHARHYMHRDIKHQNILVSDDGVYKLSDFGTARRMSGTSTFMSMKGTMAYVPPEFMTGKPVGYTADLYELGLVLYRVLNHWKMPFVPANGFSEEAGNATARRIAGEKLPPPAEASPEMAEIILKACAYDPSDRYASAEEMLEALRAIGRKSSGEAEAIRTELEACRQQLLQEETGKRLESLLKRIENLPKTEKRRKQLLDEALELREQYRAAMGEKEESDQLKLLSVQMNAWEGMPGKPNAAASLKQILEALQKMNSARPDIAAATERCRSLIRRAEKEYLEQLNRLSVQMNEWEGKLGSPDAATQLAVILHALEELDQSRPETAAACARCRDLSERAEKEYQDQLGLLSSQMNEWEGKIGMRGAVTNLKRILQALHGLDPGRPETAAAESRCRELIRRQEEAAERRKQEEELDGIAELLKYCRPRLGKKDAGDYLKAAQERLAKTDPSFPERRSQLLKEYETLEKQHAERMRQQEGLERAAGLYGRLQTCEASLGKKETTDELAAIRKEINGLDAAGRKEILAAYQRVYGEHQEALREKAAAEEFRKVHTKLTGFETGLGLSKTTDGLKQVEQKLSEMDHSRPEWQTNMNLCRDLMVRQEKALKEAEDRKLPVPKGTSSAVKAGWAWFFISGYLMAAVWNAVLEGNPELEQNTLLGILMLFAAPIFFTSMAYRISGRKFQAKRISGEQIECTWEGKPGKHYGLVRNGAWLTREAASPVTLEHAPKSPGELWLVETGEKERIIKKIDLKFIA